MRPKIDIILVTLIAAAAAAIGAGIALYYAYPGQMAQVAGETRSYLLTLNAPPGTIATEANSGFRATYAAASGPESGAAAAVGTGDWASYNKTLTSERYSQLTEINTKNVEKLKVLCTYDTKQYESFESGLIMVNGALIGTTQFDIFSLNPENCAENWRTHESYPDSILPVNRGAAYLDGLLFRGTQDGRVLAYDFKTGNRVWESTIAEPYKGVKGRMYALEAKTGRIVWEFYMVPRSEGDLVRGPLGATPLTNVTWKNIPGAPISGGGTWTSYSLDPSSGLLYVPGGNPSPDYDISVREGENLYTDSVVVLDAGTGDYKNHFKIVPKNW